MATDIVDPPGTCMCICIVVAFVYVHVIICHVIGGTCICNVLLHGLLRISSSSSACDQRNFNDLVNTI